VRLSERVIIARCTLIPEEAALSRILQALAYFSCSKTYTPIGVNDLMV